MGRRDRKSISLPHSVIVKAPGLLPMYYTSKDLADKLGVPTRTIKLWIESGLPYHRGAHNYIMIDGRDLAKWVEDQRKARAVPKLKEGEGYCVMCRKPAAILNPATVRDGNKILLKRNCGFCGARINRGIKHGQP